MVKNLSSTITIIDNLVNFISVTREGYVVSFSNLRQSTNKKRRSLVGVHRTLPWINAKVKPSGGQSKDVKPIFAYFIYDGPLLLACEGISEEVKTKCHSS
jgi:hypothetical protein